MVITTGMSILTFIGECFDGRTFGEATIMVFIVAYLCYGFIYFVENCKMNKKIKNTKLQWAENKKINNEELKRKQEDIDIELNKEREQKIDDILIQAISSENSIVLYKQCMILARGMPEYKKKITEDTARQICGENATEEQKSTIYTLLDKYEPFRDDVNRLLQTRGMEAIKNNVISKQAIEFLTSITDNDLGILKKQFMYVVDYAIFNIPNIVEEYLKKDFYINNNGEKFPIWNNISYIPKFHEQIWTSQFKGVSATAKQINKDVWQLDTDLFTICNSLNINEVQATKEQLIDFIKQSNTNKDEIRRCELQYPIFKSFCGANLYITKQPNNANNINFEIKCFLCLTDIGIEIYDLLKDEITDLPQNYITALVDDIANGLLKL